MKKFLSIALAAVLLVTALSVIAFAAAPKAADFKANNGFFIYEGKSTKTDVQDVPTVADSDNGVKVVHGGYYASGDNCGGVVSVNKYELDGFEARVYFEKAPEVTAETDCWVAFDFLAAPRAFYTNKFDVAAGGNQGIMNLVRFGRPYLEVYDGVEAFAQKYNTQKESAELNAMFSITSGTTITVKVAKNENGTYALTFEKDGKSFTVPYEFDMSKALADGKAHFSVIASCETAGDDAWTYYITNIKQKGDAPEGDGSPAAPEAPADPDAGRVITVLLNGNPIAFDVPPQLINGRTMVPLRAIFEALGAEVTWDDATQTAKGVKGDTTVTIKIGENALYKNGEKKELDVPAQLVNWRTLVPVRAISESYDVQVGWDDATSTVSLTTAAPAGLTADMFVAGNGYAVKGKDKAELSADDRKVTVAATEAGVTVSHGGYYNDGKNWGGVAFKEAVKLDGASVTIKFDKVPEVADGEDCWISVDFLAKPELFQVGNVPGNPGFMNLIRFANNKWELYEGVTAFKNIKVLDAATDMFKVKTGDVLTVSARLVDGKYEFTYVNGENKVSYTYEDEAFAKVFADGKAHLVISASCNGSAKDAFKYTITDYTYAK